MIPEPFLDRALMALPLVLFIQTSVFWVVGLYHSIWRFALPPDLMRIAKVALTGTALIFFALFIFDRMQGVLRSLPLLYLGLQMLLLAGPRLLYRWLKDHRLALHDAQRVLIVGAGRADAAASCIVSRSAGQQTRFRTGHKITEFPSLRY